MSGDLEAFLRQAAERRKAQQKKSASPNRPPSKVPVRQAERQRQSPADDEIVEAELVQRPRTLTDSTRPLAQQPSNSRSPSTPTVSSPGNSSSLSERRLMPHEVAFAVDQADERMLDHVNDTFQHKVGTLTQSRPPASSISSTPGGMPSLTSGPIEVQSGNIENPIIAKLRGKENLRAAFIAAEILKRKF